MQPELKPVPANDRILGGGGPDYAPGSALLAAGAQKVLRNTQLLLALTMVPTVIGAMGWPSLSRASSAAASDRATRCGGGAITIVEASNWSSHSS